MTESLGIRCRQALLSSAIAWSLTTPLHAKPEPPRPAALLLVTNCDDSGPGSLRDTVASAVSGDSIDLGPMGCSQLTLTTGAIVVAQDDLTIKYSGTTGRPSISANYSSRVFHHTGSGALSVDNLVIEEGKYLTDQKASGGCIDSSLGTISLSHSVVTHCIALSQDNSAYGGGLAGHEIDIYYSDIIDNRAKSYVGKPFVTSGGGAFGEFGAISYSTIIGNDATSPYKGSAGGVSLIMTSGAASIDHTLIAFNTCSHFGAGGGFENYHGTASIQLVDVTLYANVATTFAGALNLYGIDTEVRNVTIADNNITAPGGQRFGPSAAILATYSTVTLSSSIVANNRSNGYPNDGQIYNYYSTFNLDHDLVFGPSGIALPSDTLTADPLLLPLTDNGGQSSTMALRNDSPAIDQGAASDGLLTDQRGTGFARLVGARVDVGAFERQGPNDGDYIQVGNFDPQ